MERTFNSIRKNRLNFLKVISELSIDDINTVPACFNNNIIWNFGHIIASQQILCYEFTNNTPLIEESYISRYRRGTRPEGPVSMEEFQRLAGYLVTTIDRTEYDFSNGTLKDFKPCTLHSGIELLTIGDAVRWAAVHDGIHFGYAMALKRVIKG